MTAPPMLMLRDLAISAAGRAITTGTSLDIARGETIAIVGESGSGKSLTAKAIARLLPPGVSATGRVTYDGIDLLALPEREMQQIRGRRLSLMLQDPFTMLLMAGPMILLFEGAIQIARVVDKRRARREAIEGFHDLSDDEASPLDARPSALDQPLDSPTSSTRG